MNVLVLTGSPHRNDTTAQLAAAFTTETESTDNQQRAFDMEYRI